MLTIENLKSYGANVEEGLARCMNNETFYFRLINMALSDKGFGELAAAVEQGNLDTAFEKAHALKGMIGNLSLTPLYDAISDITELLRARTQMDYSSRVAKILELKKQLTDMAG